jgi:hypothetical protein
VHILSADHNVKKTVLQHRECGRCVWCFVFEKASCHRSLVSSQPVRHFVIHAQISLALRLS